jgi:hypothetical protein
LGCFFSFARLHKAKGLIIELLPTRNGLVYSGKELSVLVIDSQRDKLIVFLFQLEMKGGIG